MRYLKRPFILLLLISVFYNAFGDDYWQYTLSNPGGEDTVFYALLWIGDPDRPVRGVIITSMIRNEAEFNYDEDIRKAASDMGRLY